MEHRVKSQIPAPGEWVARGDNVILKVYDKFSQYAPAGDNIFINPAATTKKALVKTKKLCNETKKTATALLVKIQDNENKFLSLGDKLKKFFEKFKNLKKDSVFVKTAHKDLEKKAAAIAKITHKLENLVLKICETTKEFNDHTKTESEHDGNYDWINNNKEKLKELLDSAKNIVKDADLLDKESKIQLDAAMLLKDTSHAALQKIAKDVEALIETNFDDSMVELNNKAGMICTDDCSEDVFEVLRRATKCYQKNQDKLKQITAFYNTIKIDFDKKVDEVENLDQIYQKTAYLLDLSKTYVERAENAAVKGAFCVVLAENIMKKVFIPDVRGIEINKAQSMVSRKGLNVTRSELGPPPLEGKAGMVENIIPGITKRVQKGTNVTLSYYDERPDRASQLANYDCRQWPGSQPVWDTQNDRPACGCTGEMVWNQDNSNCIHRIDAALANANCGYPNSYPVWNSNQNRVVCDCIPGTVWNQNGSACINTQQAALESMDCSQYPGTIPDYDNNGNLGCACPGGTQWIQNMNRCVDQQEIAMANADCSHKPGSAPRWNYMTEQVECECQLPYTQDTMTGNCVDFMAQLEQDRREFDQEMERDRQAFDQRMAEQQNHTNWGDAAIMFFQGMERDQQEYSNPQKNKPSGSRSKKKSPGKCPGHIIICDDGTKHEKVALDMDSDEVCDICNRTIYLSHGSGVAWTRSTIENGNCKEEK